MFTEAVSHACTPALTTRSSARPVARKGTSRSSESPPTESVSTRGEMMAAFGAVEVTVTGAGQARCSRAGPRLGEQRIEIERVGHPELDAAVGREGPLVPRPVPGELEPDPERIGHVDRNAPPVSRRALERRPRGEHPPGRDREIMPGGEADRHVVEPRVVRRRGRRALTLPGVEPQVVVVVPGRDE